MKFFVNRVYPVFLKKMMNTSTVTGRLWEKVLGSILRKDQADTDNSNAIGGSAPAVKP